LVIADGRGFNGSASHGAPETPWPVIQVPKGETVNLLLCNLDPVQAHGFAIDHYFDGGVVLKPGDAYKVSFAASATGLFRIYCNIFCTVHRIMSGRLMIVV
jgi:nitrous oxide reductase